MLSVSLPDALGAPRDDGFSTLSCRESWVTRRQFFHPGLYARQAGKEFNENRGVRWGRVRLTVLLRLRSEIRLYLSDN